MSKVDLQLQLQLLWLTRPLVLWVHTSAANTGSWQWQQGRKNGQGQKISQLWSTPRQNNTCLDISYTSRAIQLSSVLHVHSFTLSKHSLTLLTHRGYTPLKHIVLSTSIVTLRICSWLEMPPPPLVDWSSTVALFNKGGLSSWVQN